jgi:hypothetical protein
MVLITLSADKPVFLSFLKLCFHSDVSPSHSMVSGCLVATGGRASKRTRMPDTSKMRSNRKRVTCWEGCLKEGQSSK